MTQLSPLSLRCISHLHKLLLSLERFLRSTRNFFTKTIPQIGQNIAFALVTLKDVGTFVPPYIYKTLALIIVLSFVTKFIRRYRNKREERGREGKRMIEENVKKDQALDRLGPEFEVKHNEGPTGPETQDQQDSCCQDLTHQLAKSDDFRDIVFFELMRGYSREAHCSQIRQEEEEQFCSN